MEKRTVKSRSGASFPIVVFFVELNTHVRQHYYGSCFIILNFDLRFHVAQFFHSEIRCNYGRSRVCLLSLAKNRDHLMVLTSSQCQQETGLTHENGWMNKYLTPLSQSAARQSLSNKVCFIKQNLRFGLKVRLSQNEFMKSSIFQKMTLKI